MTRTTRKLTELLDGKFMARLDGLDVISRKIIQGKLQGERRSKRRGEGVEFADHRPYVAGDDLRFVDWNIYGRLDALFLKLFLEEQDLSVHVMIDASSSIAAPRSSSAKSDEPSKEQAIRKLAAALGYISVVNNNRLTFSAFADGIVGMLPNIRGRNYLPQMAEFLLEKPSEGPSNFDKACKAIANMRTGRGIMIVLSDFMFKEGYETGLRRLISRQYDLYAIQVLSPQEIAPDFKGDLKLVDLEDGDIAEVTVSAALLNFYKRNLTAYCNGLKEFCTGRGARYMLANSADPVEGIVLNALRRGGLVK